MAPDNSKLSANAKRQQQQKQQKEPKKGKKGKAFDKASYEAYMAESRELSPPLVGTPSGKKKSTPLAHITNVLRASISLFQHNVLNVLLLSLCLPLEPYDNLRTAGFTIGDIIGSELIYRDCRWRLEEEDNAFEPDDEFWISVLHKRPGDGKMIFSLEIESLAYMLAERNILERYPQDGYSGKEETSEADCNSQHEARAPTQTSILTSPPLKTLQEIADEEEEDAQSRLWPSKVYQDIRWLGVRAVGHRQTMPTSWRDYYASDDPIQHPTKGHLQRMLERTDFAHNGIQYLEHVDTVIQRALVIFAEVVEEGPLDIMNNWWYDHAKVLPWRLSPRFRGVFSRMLFGVFCMDHHPQDPLSFAETLQAPYESVLQAQEYRWATRLSRKIKSLHECVIPYRETYLALAICGRLASLAEIRNAIFDSDQSLEKAMSKYLNTSVLTKAERKATYRWPKNFLSHDAQLDDENAWMKNQSPEWNLFYLGETKYNIPFDGVLKQRRSKISQELLRLVLPLSISAMIKVFKSLNQDQVRLDVQYLAFHERSFAKATHHVGRWVELHKRVAKEEVGLSLVWAFYQAMSLNFSTVSSNLGPYLSWHTVHMLAPYCEEAVSNRSQPLISSEAILQDAVQPILQDLRIFDAPTKTLGLSGHQVNDSTIAYLLGYDIKVCPWPYLRMSDVPGVPTLTPTRSQMLGAFSIISTIYADDANAIEHSRGNGKRNGVAQFLNDTVGTGKTLQAFMLITGLTHIGNALRSAYKESISSVEDTASVKPVTIPPVTLRERGFLLSRTLPAIPTISQAERMSKFPLPSVSQSPPLSSQCPIRSCVPLLPYLIVVPKSVIHQWESEWNRFVDGATFRWIRIESMDELCDKYPVLKQCPQDLNAPACPTVILTTYPVVVGSWKAKQDSTDDGPFPKGFLFDMVYSCLIADEAHRCRNVKTDEARAMLELSTRAATRVFISATAITNSVQDLVSIFTVMQHPAIADEKASDTWTTVTDRLKEAEVARRKYRAAVLPSLGPADWYRHVESPAERSTESDLDSYEVLGVPAHDPDVIYTQSHFRDLLDQRKHARTHKKVKRTMEQDKADLVAKSKAYRQTYENLDAIALAMAMTQVGPSIIRRSGKSKTYANTAFDSNGFLLYPLQTEHLEPVLESFDIERRLYKVIPGMEERKIVTDLLVANSATDEPMNKNSPEEQDAESDDEANADPSIEASVHGMSATRRDAFHTLGRLAALFLSSAQWPGTPIQLQQGALRILCSAKLSMMSRICLKIVTSDKSRPVEEQRKIAIFVRWTSGFPIIQYHLLQVGLGSVTLSGEDSAQQRDSIVQGVQQPGPHRVEYSSQLSSAIAADPRTKTNHNILNSHILILSEAGGEGLNLTRISELIILDGMWTPADEHQLLGRFARRGQTKPVTIHCLETPGTADEPMKLALQQKSTLFDINTVFETDRLHPSVQDSASDLLRDLGAMPITRQQDRPSSDLQQFGGSQRSTVDPPVVSGQKSQPIASKGDAARPVAEISASWAVQNAIAAETSKSTERTADSTLHARDASNPETETIGPTFQYIETEEDTPDQLPNIQASAPFEKSPDKQGSITGVDKADLSNLEVDPQAVEQGLASPGARAEILHPDDGNFPFNPRGVIDGVCETLDRHPAFLDQDSRRNVIAVTETFFLLERCPVISQADLRDMNGSTESLEDPATAGSIGRDLPEGWYEFTTFNDALRLFLAPESFIKAKKKHATVSAKAKKVKAQRKTAVRTAAQTNFKLYDEDFRNWSERYRKRGTKRLKSPVTYGAHRATRQTRQNEASSPVVNNSDTDSEQQSNHAPRTSPRAPTPTMGSNLDGSVPSTEVEPDNPGSLGLDLQQGASHNDDGNSFFHLKAPLNVDFAEAIEDSLIPTTPSNTQERRGDISDETTLVSEHGGTIPDTSALQHSGKASLREQPARTSPESGTTFDLTLVGMRNSMISDAYPSPYFAHFQTPPQTNGGQTSFSDGGAGRKHTPLFNSDLDEGDDATPKARQHLDIFSSQSSRKSSPRGSPIVYMRKPKGKKRALETDSEDDQIHATPVATQLRGRDREEPQRKKKQQSQPSAPQFSDDIWNRLNRRKDT